jgi:hypothetical protein
MQADEFLVVAPGMHGLAPPAQPIMLCDTAASAAERQQSTIMYRQLFADQ